MKETLLLKTSEQIKLLASPEYQVIMNELPFETGITAQDLSKKFGTPLLDVCYSLEKLEKSGFITLLSEDRASGVLGKKYVRIAKDYSIKRIVGDYEEVKMQVSNAELIVSEEPKRGCSFCGTSVDKVKRLIKGQADAHICDKCVTKCYELLTK